MIELGGVYKLKGMDFGDFIKDDDQCDYKVIGMEDDTVACERQDDEKEVFFFNKDHLIDPEKPDDKYTKWKIVMEKLSSVVKPSDNEYWQELQEEGCAGGCTCASAASFGGIGAAPTPAVGQVQGATVNGIPVEGKSAKKKKKKNEEFEPEIQQMLVQAQSEENAAIQSYLDKAQRCRELGIEVLANMFDELANDETVHTGCLQGAAYHFGVDNTDAVLKGQEEVAELLDDIEWIDEDFNEAYEKITNEISRYLNKLNFEFANTEDIVYKKEGENKYLFKFDNAQGIIKIKVLHGEDVLVEKEYKLEEEDDVQPIFDEIETIYRKYGL